MKYIVVFGSVTDGFEFYGPFDSYENADLWAKLGLATESGEVVVLKQPDQRKNVYGELIDCGVVG